MLGRCLETLAYDSFLPRATTLSHRRGGKSGACNAERNNYVYDAVGASSFQIVSDLFSMLAVSDNLPQRILTAMD